MKEINEKVQNMLNIIEKDFEHSKQQLQHDYNKKIERLKHEIDVEINTVKDNKMKAVEHKIKTILNSAKSKASLYVKSEKIKLEAEFIEKIVEEIRVKLINLNEKDKLYFYQKLYFDASKMMGKEYEVLCNPSDIEIVKSIVKDHEVLGSEKIESGIVLKNNNVTISNTVDVFIKENKEKIYNAVIKEAGENQ